MSTGLVPPPGPMGSLCKTFDLYVNSGAKNLDVTDTEGWNRGISLGHAPFISCLNSSTNSMGTKG